jgi:hypothetical protein
MIERQTPTTSKTALVVARTGILLALTVVFQYVGRFIPLGPNSNFIVGPLVNACLLVSAVAAGIWGGLTISVVAPLFAALTTTAPVAPFLLVFSPFIAAGNFVLVLIFYLIKNKSIWLGIITGAVLKFIILYGGLHIMLNLREVPGNLQNVLRFMFGWPQLVTALIGGGIAVIALKVLKKELKAR